MERIQKRLAAAGVGSRRQIEGWIRQGRIRVDGVPAQLGQKVSGSEVIEKDGQPVDLEVAEPGQHEHLIYYKPTGQLTSRWDDEKRPLVFDVLPDPSVGRWISVGRLDFNTLGLLLLTTDGALAHRLMHPSTGLERRYAVRVRGPLSQATQRILLRGVELEDGPAKLVRIERASGSDAGNVWYKVSLREGRNREVRRLFAAVDHEVTRLIRTGFGPIELDSALRRGDYRPLKHHEARSLYRAAGLSEGASPSSGR